MTDFTRRAALAALAAAAAAPAHAHSLQEFEDEFYAKEPYFQALDRPVPDFTLSDAAGKLVRPADLLGKVTVLHFIYSSCTDVCPLHAEKLAEVQKMTNQTPMIDLVRFVSITTDPTRDTPEVLKDYGPQHGLDPVNWQFLTIAPGQPEDQTRKLAEAFGHKFTVESDGTITHGVVTHIIGKYGRWQGNFHGLEFQPMTMLMFVNALTNDFETPQPGLWDRVRSWL
ncbi:MAG TPA: SCO family protein [Albidovulum sp.]|uniref:SCO family protein n=1 Tax=Albidovulum sp. TaxID=1872424 RepID=UPI002BCBE270|nr:SCO family protein [Albidovulum sp.]